MNTEYDHMNSEMSAIITRKGSTEFFNRRNQSRETEKTRNESRPKESKRIDIDIHSKKDNSKN